MHDIGTSRPGGWGPGYNNEFEQELAPELAGEFGQELENEFAGEFENEFEAGANEFENEFETEVSGEMQELELAAELLSVNSEQELEQFLGGLIRSVGRVATNFAKSSAGKALGGILRSAAKSALPIVGSALGNLIVPGAGGLIGGKLAGMAGSALGLELEGLSNEDREFEVARRLVRIGQHSVRHLHTMPRNMPPARAARIAFLRGARQVAPGLLTAMRLISRNGIAAARQARTPIFGPPSGTPRLPRPQGAMPRPYTDGSNYGNYSNYGNVENAGNYGTFSDYGGTPAPQAQSGYGDTASAGCPSCGAALPHGAAVPAAMPASGQWRRSRNGRAIIVYLAAHHPAY